MAAETWQAGGLRCGVQRCTGRSPQPHSTHRAHCMPLCPAATLRSLPWEGVQGPAAPGGQVETCPSRCSINKSKLSAARQRVRRALRIYSELTRRAKGRVGWKFFKRPNCRKWDTLGGAPLPDHFLKPNWQYWSSLWWWGEGDGKDTEGGW